MVSHLVWGEGIMGVRVSPPRPYFMINDDLKLKRKFHNKRVNALKEGIEFEISYDEICILLMEANLKSSDWGFSGNGYVLARYNDTGSYKYGNCRFIKQSENAKEKIITNEAKNSSARNIKKALIALKNNPEAMTKRSESLARYWENKRNIARLKEAERQNNLNPIFKGEKNSQFGSMWITNGTENKKIKKVDIIPEGWYKGRKM